MAGTYRSGDDGETQKRRGICMKKQCFMAAFALFICKDLFNNPNPTGFSKIGC
jgi:hypothetical protein